MATRTDPALATSSALVGLHFQLECYVGPGGALRASPFEGWATFAQILVRRPDKYRFAVARRVPLKLVRITATRDIVEAGDAPAGEWLAWDLLSDAVTRGASLRSTGKLPSSPPALWESEHLDGLVMKCIALYDA